MMDTYHQNVSLMRGQGQAAAPTARSCLSLRRLMVMQ